MIEFELVLPCYNESKSLELLAKRSVDAAQDAGFTPHRFKLVLVENGSSDDSREVLDQISNSPLGNWIRVVNVDKNQGYGFGLFTGLRSTTAPVIGWSHADLQCDPKDAFRAYHLLSQGDTSRRMVKGIRIGRSTKERIVSRVFEYFAFILLGLKCYELNAQPKIVSREILKYLDAPPSNFAFDLYAIYIAAKQSFSIETIEVAFPPRAFGISNWAGSFLSRYRTILKMILYMRQLAKSSGRL